MKLFARTFALAALARRNSASALALAGAVGLLIAGPTGCKRGGDAEAATEVEGSTELASVLPAWSGTLTELVAGDPALWAFIELDSMRADDDFAALLREVESEAPDALAHALLDASQIYVSWADFSDDTRLSIVRTNIPADEIRLAMATDAGPENLTATTGPEGLPLWVNEAGTWAIAVPAENLLMAGQRGDVEAAAQRLLDTADEDQLAGIDGFVFGVTPSNELRELVLGIADEAMVQRAVNSVREIVGTGTLGDGLELRADVRLDATGNARLLATIGSIGWRQLVPALLGEYFQPAYVARLAEGFSAEALDGTPMPTTRFTYRLPASDTQLWLRQFAGGLELPARLDPADQELVAENEPSPEDDDTATATPSDVNEAPADDDGAGEEER